MMINILMNKILKNMKTKWYDLFISSIFIYTPKYLTLSLQEIIDQEAENLDGIVGAGEYTVGKKK